MQSNSGKLADAIDQPEYDQGDAYLGEASRDGTVSIAHSVFLNLRMSLRAQS